MGGSRFSWYNGREGRKKDRNRISDPRVQEDGGGNVMRFMQHFIALAFDFRELDPRVRKTDVVYVQYYCSRPQRKTTYFALHHQQITNPPSSA